MNKKYFAFIFVMALVACSSRTTSSNLKSLDPQYVCVPLAPSKMPQKIWELNGFFNPESAIYDEKTKAFYVSNVNGSPVEKDGKASISKISRNGKKVQSSWATGTRGFGASSATHLNAPKGLRIKEGVLWTADIDEVVGFDLRTGKVAARIKVSGAKFLNDIHFFPGTHEILVTDMLESKIFLLAKKGNSVLVEGSAVENPNGLFTQNDSLYVATWGPGLKGDFSTEKPGQILVFDFTKNILLPWNGYRLGNLDGLEADGSDAFLVSDWMAGKVYRVTKSGDCQVLLEGFKGAADIGWDPATRTLVVPRMNENKVSAYRLP